MTDPMAAQTAGAQSVPGTDGPISVPSGQPVTLMDVIWNERGPEGLTFRFRFLAPQIARQGGTVDYETAAVDMLHLCQSYALPRVPNTGPQPSQIIISLSDQPVPFGQTAPLATQFFQPFSFHNGTCIWEIY